MRVRRRERESDAGRGGESDPKLVNYEKLPTNTFKSACTRCDTTILCVSPKGEHYNQLSTGRANMKGTRLLENPVGRDSN